MHGCVVNVDSHEQVDYQGYQAFEETTKHRDKQFRRNRQFREQKRISKELQLISSKEKRP